MAVSELAGEVAMLEMHADLSKLSAGFGVMF
jgi:hypothetical protein